MKKSILIILVLCSFAFGQSDVEVYDHYWTKGDTLTWTLKLFGQSWNGVRYSAGFDSLQSAFHYAGIDSVLPDTILAVPGWLVLAPDTTDSLVNVRRIYGDSGFVMTAPPTHTLFWSVDDTTGFYNEVGYLTFDTVSNVLLAGGRNVVDFGAALANAHFIEFSNSQNITMDGHHIILTDTTVQAAEQELLQFSNCDSVFIKNLKIENSNGSPAIYLYNCNHVFIDNVTVDGAEVGLYVRGGRNVIIRNSHFSHSDSSGVRIRDVDRVTVDGVVSCANAEYGFIFDDIDSLFVTNCESFANTENDTFQINGGSVHRFGDNIEFGKATHRGLNILLDKNETIDITTDTDSSGIQINFKRLGATDDYMYIVKYSALHASYPEGAEWRNIINGVVKSYIRMLETGKVIIKDSLYVQGPLFATGNIDTYGKVDSVNIKEFYLDYLSHTHSGLFDLGDSLYSGHFYKSGSAYRIRQAGLDADSLKALFEGDALNDDHINEATLELADLGEKSYNSLTDKPTTFPPESHTHTEIDITDLDHFTNADETDQVFVAWDKSTGISITESQISDLDHFTNADETDQVFTAWDKSTGIEIYEAQVLDLDKYTQSQVNTLLTTKDNYQSWSFGLNDVEKDEVTTGDIFYLNDGWGIKFYHDDTDKAAARVDTSVVETKSFAAKTYLTSYSETDPVYINDPAFSIASGDITNWDAAFNWGDHALEGYLTGNQNITLSGDIGGSGSTSISTTIQDNSVDGTDIALGSDAQGDVMYYDGFNWARLAAGTSGYFLKTQGAGANPVWSSVGASLTQEDVEDYAGGMWSGNTETGVSVIYQDADGTLDIANLFSSQNNLDAYVDDIFFDTGSHGVLTGPGSAQGLIMQQTDNTGYSQISGGTNWRNGANIWIYGSSHASYPGKFRMYYGDYDSAVSGEAFSVYHWTESSGENRVFEIGEDENARFYYDVDIDDDLDVVDTITADNIGAGTDWNGNDIGADFLAIRPSIGLWSDGNVLDFELNTSVFEWSLSGVYRLDIKDGGINTDMLAESAIDSSKLDSTLKYYIRDKNQKLFGRYVEVEKYNADSLIIDIHTLQGVGLDVDTVAIGDTCGSWTLISGGRPLRFMFRDHLGIERIDNLDLGYVIERRIRDNDGYSVNKNYKVIGDWTSSDQIDINLLEIGGASTTSWVTAVCDSNFFVSFFVFAQGSEHF